MAKRLIALDPGHGGTDPGAIGNGFKEKDLTLQLALNVGEHLKGYGFDVFFTRTTDIYLPLKTRTDRINSAKPIASLSIHINSFYLATANGIEIFHHPKAPIADKEFVKVIWDMVKGLGFKQRGVKTKNLHMLREIDGNIPAGLIEVGFIKNKADLDRLLNNLQEISRAIAGGIAMYFGPVEEPEEKPLTLKEQIKTKMDELYKLIKKL